MSWSDAQREIDEALRLAGGNRGNDALFAWERAGHLLAADLTGSSLTELKNRRLDNLWFDLKRKGLISSEDAELLDGLRRLRNTVAHPPFTFRLEGRSLIPALKRVKEMVESRATPLHQVAIRELYHVDPDTSAIAVAVVMAKEDFTHVPVLINGETRGTVNERSVVELFANADSSLDYLDKRVSEVMTAPLPVHHRSSTVYQVMPDLYANGAVLVSLRDGPGIFTLWDLAELGP